MLAGWSNNDNSRHTPIRIKTERCQKGYPSTAATEGRPPKPDLWAFLARTHCWAYCTLTEAERGKGRA